MSITVNHLSFGYSKKAHILSDLNIFVDEGDCILIAGHNGAGKSTLLKLLNGILKPDSGNIIVNGHDTRVVPTSVLASHIVVTFQNPADQIFASTVRDEIAFGSRILRQPGYQELVERSIELFGLDDYASRHPYDLSLAHRKLVTIASAVATGSPILAFDEPSASLSQTERKILLRAVEELRSKKRTLLIVSHDFEFFFPVVSRLIVISGGNIAYAGTPMDILQNRGIARSSGLRIPLVLRLQEIAGSAEF